MPKGLPDSMTYTMGKRVVRVARDKNAESADRLDEGAETLAYVVYGTLAVVKAALWVIFAPIILLGWLAQKELDRMARRDARIAKQARYNVAVARKKKI